MGSEEDEHLDLNLDTSEEEESEDEFLVKGKQRRNDLLQKKASTLRKTAMKKRKKRKEEEMDEEEDEDSWSDWSNDSEKEDEKEVVKGKGEEEKDEGALLLLASIQQKALRGGRGRGNRGGKGNNGENARRRAFGKTSQKLIRDEEEEEEGIDDDGKRKKLKEKKGEKKRKREGCGKWVWALFIAFALFTVIARYQMEQYDVDYDEFMSNYAVLGLPESASLQEVRKAYRGLSLQWHPDKNPRDCIECKEKYIEIVHAYETISEFEKGKIHLVNRPGEEGGRPQTQKPKGRAR